MLKMDFIAVKLTTIYCLITSIYVPLLLTFLVSTESLYTIGKFNTGIYPLVCLMLGELLKVCLVTRYFSAKEHETIKFKKYYTKFKIKELCKIVTNFCGTTLICYLIAILFGAPFLSSFEETFVLSLLVTIMSVFSASINIGADNALHLLVGIKCDDDVFLSMFNRNVQFTILGTWLGAIVIPLDWDRPWQEWPIPCYIGALLGYTVSNVLSLLQLSTKFTKIFLQKNVKTNPKNIT